jgi:hypothetical protein
MSPTSGIVNVALIGYGMGGAAHSFCNTGTLARLGR